MKKVLTKNCHLKDHVRENHKAIEKYKCDKCDKTFLLKWRLRKHREGHEKNSKKCHYFNNNLICCNDKIGCMFDHKLSGPCEFGSTCVFNLCPFQHVPDIDKIERELRDKFDKYSWKEQYEAKMAVCDVFCNGPMGKHRCDDEEFEALIGLDALQATEDYDSDCNK